jgi:hypothetical protein
VYAPSIANIVTKTISRTNASFATVNVVPGIPGHVFCVCSAVFSSNDTTTQTTGLQDDASLPIYFAYVGATSPPVAEFSYDAMSHRGAPIKTGVGNGVQVNTTQPTAGKTVEVSVSGFYLKVA